MAQRRILLHVTSYDLTSHVAHVTSEVLTLADGALEHMVADPGQTDGRRVVSRDPALVRYVIALTEARSEHGSTHPLPRVCADCNNTGWTTDAEGNGGDCMLCAN